MKIKTNELIGAALDRAVAEASGYSLNTLDLMYDIKSYAKFNPTTDWAQGGPIIERERIALTAFLRADLVTQWRAVTFTSGTVPVYGSTPLIAAMRCFISSRLGDEVEAPDELDTLPDQRVPTAWPFNQGEKK